MCDIKPSLHWKSSEKALIISVEARKLTLSFRLVV